MEKRDPLKSKTCNDVDHSTYLTKYQSGQRSKIKNALKYKRKTHTHTHTHTHFSINFDSIQYTYFINHN